MQFNIAVITYDSFDFFFLTNSVLIYNDNFINYFVWKNNFLIFGKKSFIFIVLGLYWVVNTVVSFKVVMTKTLYTCVSFY